ncbi:MAG: hypothetical protein V3T28_07190 [Gemmatimonadales bacterium]
MLWISIPLHMPYGNVRNTPRFKKLLGRLGVAEPDLVAERSRVERWLAEVKAKGVTGR